MSHSPDAPSARPWRDPHWRLRWLVPGLALAVALVVLVRAHLHFFFPWAGPVSNDEGYISALALRMIHGRWLPYVDGVSQRGPIIYWLAAFAMKVGGQFSWLPIRWLALLSGIGAVLLSFFVAAEVATPLAGGVAALFLTYFLSYELNPWDGIGYNGEIVGIQFVLGSLLLVARAQREGALALPRRDRVLFAAGALAALAGLSKQMTLIHAGPSLLWLALGAPGDGRPLARRLRDVAVFGAGASVPYAVVFAVYAATGHLRDFVYYYQRYGRDIFMAPLTRDYMRDKAREQIDRYFLGGSMVSMLGVVALSRVLRGYAADVGPRLARVLVEEAQQEGATVLAGVVGLEDGGALGERDRGGGDDERDGGVGDGGRDQLVTQPARERAGVERRVRGPVHHDRHEPLERVVERQGRRDAVVLATVGPPVDVHQGVDVVAALVHAVVLVQPLHLLGPPGDGGSVLALLDPVRGQVRTGVDVGQEPGVGGEAEVLEVPGGDPATPGEPPLADHAPGVEVVPLVPAVVGHLLAPVGLDEGEQDGADAHVVVRPCLDASHGPRPPSSGRRRPARAR